MTLVSDLPYYLRCTLQRKKIHFQLVYEAPKEEGGSSPSSRANDKYYL